MLGKSSLALQSSPWFMVHTAHLPLQQLQAKPQVHTHMFSVTRLHPTGGLHPPLTAPLSHCRAQVAEERRLGLTPALHMDATDERVQCQLEINFIDCVVTPLWEHCAHCFPALQPCMERVRANRAAYAALANCSNEEVAQVSTPVSDFRFSTSLLCPCQIL